MTAAPDVVTPASAPLSPAAPAAEAQPLETSPAELDRALAELGDKARSFARMSAREKAALLREVLPRALAAAPRMVEAGCNAKGIDPRSARAGEEWLGAACPFVANVRLLADALDDIAARGAPRLPFRAIRTRDDGRVTVRVYPMRGADAALLGGFTCDVLLQEGARAGDVRAEQASFYKQQDPEGGVSLVLGAGNVASIPPMDALQKLFVEGKVVLLKMSPVNAYLGPILGEALAPLVERGLLRIVYGGASAGAYLAAHPAVADIHVTGSQRTHDAIVWGPPGPEQDARRARGERLSTKPITSELGNISPVMVVPYLYAEDELWFQARSVATAVVNNGSFNCNAAKMLVLPRGWAQRDVFLAHLRRALASVPPRKAYYPGAPERHAALTEGRSRVTRIGQAGPGELPWTLIEGLDPEATAEPLFSTEPFCSILSVVEVGSDDPAHFLDAATSFCNTRLWGTLSATIVVHPFLADDPAVGRALDRAILELRYGAVAINHWPAFVYALVTPPWGGHPSATLSDVQSGLGFVHNTPMLERIEKAVLRGPLVGFPRPPIFYDHKKMHLVGERMCRYWANPGWGRLPAVAMAALAG
jgi:acyl-CoA reductase-like NAD-dependent aldehyde dehydrogenase